MKHQTDKGMEFPVHLPSINGNSAYTTFKTGLDNGIEMPFMPNVISDMAYMDYGFADDEQAELRIYDLNGKLVKNSSLIGEGTYELYAGELSQGVYLYRVLSEHGIVYRGKFVIVE